MGIKYLWDTNIAIYYLQHQLSAQAENFIDTLLLNEQPIISAITEIELLCWKAATEKDMEVLRNFISDSLVIELEQTIKMKTAELRKTYRIKLPDAIIAATSMVYDLTLLSHNTVDFQKIPQLNLIDPWLTKAE